MQRGLSDTFINVGIFREKSGPIGQVMSQFKLRCRHRSCDHTVGRGICRPLERRRWRSSRWRRRWWPSRWWCACWRRWCAWRRRRTSHQCQTGDIPFVCGADLARQWSFGRSYPFEQFRRQRTFLNSTGNEARKANVNTNVKSHAVRNTLNSASVAGVLRNRSALRNPGTRAHITASAATAGWHEGRDGANGWWRHRNGGYGWVGPLYWPFAYNDMYDCACGVMATTTRSGATATATFMLAFSRHTVTTTSPAIRRNTPAAIRAIVANSARCRHAERGA